MGICENLQFPFSLLSIEFLIRLFYIKLASFYNGFTELIFLAHGICVMKWIYFDSKIVFECFSALSICAKKILLLAKAPMSLSAHLKAFENWQRYSQSKYLNTWIQNSSLFLKRWFNCSKIMKYRFNNNTFSLDAWCGYVKILVVDSRVHLGGNHSQWHVYKELGAIFNSQWGRLSSKDQSCNAPLFLPIKLRCRGQQTGLAAGRHSWQQATCLCLHSGLNSKRYLIFLANLFSMFRFCTQSKVLFASDQRHWRTHKFWLSLCRSQLFTLEFGCLTLRCPSFSLLNSKTADTTKTSQSCCAPWLKCVWQLHLQTSYWKTKTQSKILLKF